MMKTLMQSKNSILIVGAIFIIALGVYFFGSIGGNVLGEDVAVNVFTSGGDEFNTASVSIPFVKSAGDGVINVVLDFNNDGTLSSDEWMVVNFPAHTQEDWRNNYAFSYTDEFSDDVAVRVIFSTTDIEDLENLPKDSNEISVLASVNKHEVGDLYDIQSVTNVEESMKGWGISVAYGEDLDITTEGVPDISQRPGECGPTSAANSLISLINEHGNDDQKPDSETQLIDELKKDMGWTPENGVLPDDFVAGKNAWAGRNGIPIRTEKVGDANGISTLDAISDALSNGDAVELRIKFGNPETGKAVGGHMVTVTGIHVDGDETHIDINDPASPSGTDTYEISGNTFVNYPFKGWTLLSWAFTQTWEGDPTGAGFDELTDEEIAGIRNFVGEDTKIKVIQVGSKYLPVSSLRVVKEELGCEEGTAHWHPSQGGSVTSTDDTTVTDRNERSCGYGTLEEKPVIEVSP